MVILPAWWFAQQRAATVLSFIGFILASVPLYWLLENWNVGCVLYILWCSSQCLINFINMNIWSDNADNRAPIWCDIVTRFGLASTVGTSAAALVVNRRLYRLTTMPVVTMTQRDKNQMVVVDLFVSLAPPVLIVALYWFIQGHRFDIYEGYGCMYEIPNTILSYFLLTAWPITLGCISAIYGALVLHRLLTHREELRAVISINENLSFYRYIRLMGLAGCHIIYTIPLASWVLYRQTRSPLYEWRGLGNLHYDFGRIGQYPAILWWYNPRSKSAILFTSWSGIASAFLFFAFFGCAEEARKHYTMAARAIARIFGWPKAS